MCGGRREGRQENEWCHSPPSPQSTHKTESTAHKRGAMMQCAARTARVALRGTPYDTTAARPARPTARPPPAATAASHTCSARPSAPGQRPPGCCDSVRRARPPPRRCRIDRRRSPRAPGICSDRQHRRGRSCALLSHRSSSCSPCASGQSRQSRRCRNRRRRNRRRRCSPRASGCSASLARRRPSFYSRADCWPPASSSAASLAPRPPL